MRGALDNADLPFMRVVEAAGVPRSAAYSPLFQVMLSLQDASLAQDVAMEGLKQEAVEVPPVTELAGHTCYEAFAGLCFTSSADS